MGCFEGWHRFVGSLRAWYQADSRVLPWKGHDDPYHIWVSEVFLQQTQAERVVDFYIRFTAKFPTVEKLAEASFEEALPYFRGLGFYGRLRRMLSTAKAVVDVYGGKFPRSLDELMGLPGIGPYTARAIASFAFGERILAPDTNVVRVVGRYFGIRNQELGIRNQVFDEVWMKRYVLSNLNVLDELYPKNFNLNQALMDFGSSVCLAKQPKCSECSLRNECWYGNNGGPKTEYVKKGQLRFQRSLRDYKKVVCGVLIHEGKILVTRRRADQTYAGLLEFPGGKVEQGEDGRMALRREFLEELGIDISVRPAFAKVPVAKTKLLLSFHRCRVLTGEPRALEGQEMLWLAQADLDEKAFIPVNVAVIDQLKGSRL